MNTALHTQTNKRGRVDLLYPELSYDVVGLCYNTHNEIGGFAREKQYADAFEQKLKEAGVQFKREFVIGDTGNTVDFFIEGKIIVEFKARRFLSPGDFMQTQRYLQATGVRLGILVNFGAKYVQAERVVLIERPAERVEGLIRKHL
jgi:GxxExxY protein